MFLKFLRAVCDREANSRFVSLGSGNCDIEIELALQLRSSGHTGFAFDCIDLNPAMLERGRTAAMSAGVASQFSFLEGDLNSWNPAREYSAVLANYALHHVVNLEGLLDQVRRSLTARGYFLVTDIIGRNGHLRWPEALEIVHEFWRKLPPSYRFNQQLHRYEELLEEWDCSTEAFEGIRAQDILPSLLSQFHFHLFVPFGNIIDPFIDRSFGVNFDASAEWDRKFIDVVHERDEEGLRLGRLTPTHMFAVLTADSTAPLLLCGERGPDLCVRAAGGQSVRAMTAAGPLRMGFLASQPASRTGNRLPAAGGCGL